METKQAKKNIANALKISYRYGFNIRHCLFNVKLIGFCLSAGVGLLNVVLISA